jgi:hypothetical protein
MMRVRTAASRLFSSTSEPIHTVVFLGSTRAKRIGGSVADVMVQKLQAKGHQTILIDPREAADGFFMTMMEKAYFHYKEVCAHTDVLVLGPAGPSTNTQPLRL